MTIRIVDIETEERRGLALPFIISGYVDRSTSADDMEWLGPLRSDSWPDLRTLCENLESRLGLESEMNGKSEEAARDKCTRPEIVAHAPWFPPRHLRDFLRFRTYLDEPADFGRVMTFFMDEVSAGRIFIVKIDVAKLVQPRYFGWRMIAVDLRIRRTGMLAEHYMTFRDLIRANEDWLHPVYERWRARDPDILGLTELDAFDRHARLSSHAYRELPIDALVDSPAGDTSVRLQRGLTAIALERVLERIVNAAVAIDRSPARTRSLRSPTLPISKSTAALFMA